MQVCTSSLPLGSRRRRARDNCFCGRRSEQTHRSCPRHPLSQHSPPPRAHNCKHTMAQQLLVRQQQAACAGASCSGRWGCSPGHPSPPQLLPAGLFDATSVVPHRRRCSLRPAPLGRTAAVQGLPSYVSGQGCNWASACGHAGDPGLTSPRVLLARRRRGRASCRDRPQSTATTQRCAGGASQSRHVAAPGSSSALWRHAAAAGVGRLQPTTAAGCPAGWPHAGP